jgi:hypothetical protein
MAEEKKYTKSDLKRAIILPMAMVTFVTFMIWVTTITPSRPVGWEEMKGWHSVVLNLIIMFGLMFMFTLTGGE